MLMAQVLNPVVSEFEAKKQFDQVADIFLKGSKMAFLIGLPACVILIFMGDQFIRIWMGVEYASIGGAVLIILAVKSAIGLPQYTANNVLYGISRHNIMGYSRIFEAILNVVLAVSLIPKFGIYGVAIGFAIPHIILTFLVLPMIVSRSLKLRLFAYYRYVYVGPMLSALPLAAVSFVFRERFAAATLTEIGCQVCLLVVTYFVTAWLVCFSKRERRLHVGLLSNIWKERNQIC
jgi:O-antigen/teichoic acid export membrane protein